MKKAFIIVAALFALFFVSCSTYPQVNAEQYKDMTKIEFVFLTRDYIEYEAIDYIEDVLYYSVQQGGFTDYEIVSVEVKSELRDNPAMFGLALLSAIASSQSGGASEPTGYYGIPVVVYYLYVRFY